MSLSVLAAAAGGQNYMFIILMILMFGGMYFLSIRPQKKQQAKRAEMMQQMKKGDPVVTIGGMKGKIDEVDNETKEVVIDVDGVFLTFDMGAIKTVTPTNTAKTTSTSTKKIVEDQKPEDKK
ncbi:preprotein translocase subunit YajC [Companilactobacillus sp. RD055328]|uniref:preprotein translocase subunit YajC n=1 Tax=Companilactobacillus sp. RD055328 TaxID=2916634 RepID=UPI001FC8D8D2|nr:preprotein translocase subunit YajC [Companilactobacillus sp. RD055328]GKQ42106.1 preprotein translocase subunit YajC [Companilactobacillus sp. RD055328]